MRTLVIGRKTIESVDPTCYLCKTNYECYSWEDNPCPRNFCPCNTGIGYKYDSVR